MRLGVAIFVIFLIFGAIWFAFFYYFDVPDQTSLSQGFSQKELSSDEQAFLLAVTENNYSPVRDFTIADPTIGAVAAALYDVNSGRFLYSKYINKRLPIASVTKLVTAIVVINKLDLEEIYTVPVEAVNVDGLGADLYKGERLKGEDLLKIMLIESSNDAALTFSSEAQKRGIDLVSEMNKLAQDAGMTATLFFDPAGLDDQNAFSTVSDLVKLVQYAFDYDLILKILIMPVADITSTDGRISHHLINTNHLLGRISNIIVGKTGYTDKALGTMVLGVSINDGKDKLISVVLGSNDRFGEIKILGDWALKAYKWE